MILLILPPEAGIGSKRDVLVTRGSGLYPSQIEKTNRIKPRPEMCKAPVV